MFPNLKRLLGELKKFNFNPNSFVIGASGSMAAHGIRDCRDLDITCDRILWAKIKHNPKNKTGSGVIIHPEIECFPDDYPRIGGYELVQKLIREADIINGVRFENMKSVLEWKQLMGREKDLKDVKLIKKYLEEHHK